MNSMDLPSPKSRYNPAPEIHLQRSSSVPPSPMFSPLIREPDLAQQHILKINQLTLENKALSAKNESLLRERTSNDRLAVILHENDALLEENNKLQKQLLQSENGRSQVEAQYNKLDKSHGALHDDSGLLQQKLAITLQQKDAIEKTLEGNIKDLENSNYEQQVLEGEYRSSCMETKSSNSKVHELQKSIEEITSRYQLHVSESRAQSARERQLMDSLKATEYDLHELRIQTTMTKNDFNALDLKFEEIARLCKTLESRLTESRDENADMQQKVQANAEQSRESLLERDNAILREEQALKEVARLESKIGDIQCKYRDKSETEIATIRTQFIAEKNRMSQEISALQNTCSKMQVMADRAIREKRSAESELDKLTQHIPVESERLQGILEDLTTRLHSVQTDRTDALQRLEGMHSRHAREITQLEREKIQLQEVSESSYKRLRKLCIDYEESKDECVKLTAQLSNLDHAHKKILEQSFKSGIQHGNDMNTQSQKYDMQIQELSEKLKEVTSAHHKTCQEMHQVLSAQRQTSQKWSTESKSITTHYESIITDLRAQNSRIESRIRELEEDISKRDKEREGLVSLVQTEKQASARVYTRLSAAEVQAALLNRQIQQYLVREGEILGEKAILEREVERSLGEADRVRREMRTYARFERKERDGCPSVDPLADGSQLLADIQRVKMRSRLARPIQYDQLVDFENEDTSDEDI